MNRLLFAGISMVLALSFMPVTNAAETKCKGDALREQPPIPNYPHHIRNVVWRNTRAMCLQELSQKSTRVTNSNTTPAQPTSK